VKRVEKKSEKEAGEKISIAVISEIFQLFGGF
jgi:hypothetical protein